jgi:hypothetical protein
MTYYIGAHPKDCISISLNMQAIHISTTLPSTRTIYLSRTDFQWLITSMYAIYKFLQVPRYKISIVEYMDDQ